MLTEPIRVLHNIGSLHFGGSQTLIASIYKNIDREKVQFDFVVTPEERSGLYDEVEKLGAKIYCCVRYTVKNHFEYCRWWNDFFKNHPEYHVIHGHVRSTAAIYLKIAKKYGLVTIAHSHSTSNGRGVSAVIKNVMQLPIRNIADYLFACSDKAGVWLYGKKAIKQANYRVIPNGIDLKRFSFDPEKRRRMRQSLEIQETTMVLGHVGRFTVPKNHTLLLEIFAQYHKNNPDSCLLLVGDGELFRQIQHQCHELGVCDAVKMVGDKTNTEDYYQMMDVFVFPSLWEGLGIVAIEAQANGLPCLVSDNVPQEALVTDNAKALSLNNTDDWLRELENLHPKERAYPLDRRLYNFDIVTVASWLQSFYLEQHGKVGNREKCTLAL